MQRPMQFTHTVCAVAFIAAFAVSQGPASCGFHLDIIANQTSTHSAIADMPGAPGAISGYAPGAAGNPYCAYADPGTVIRFKCSLPGTVLGLTPGGAGAPVSILAAVNAGNIGVAPPLGSVGACQGGPWIISVLPFAGAVVDGLGALTAPPIIPPAIAAHPDGFEFAAVYPPALAGLTLTFQAATVVNGVVAVSNGVSLLAGSNPHETSLIPTLVASCPVFNPLDEGGAPITMPPGFVFEGLATANGYARPNGYVDFGPAANTVCDYIPGGLGLGCLVSSGDTSPRISVCHGDYDLNNFAPAPFGPDMTVEYVGPTPGVPSRTIVRWKNDCVWFVPPNSVLTEYGSFACEFFGSDAATPSASAMAVVRQHRHVTFANAIYGFTGIGPGGPGQGYNGPSNSCGYVPISNYYGTSGYFSAPGEAILIDLPVNEGYLALNMAIVFRPTSPPGANPSYGVTTY